MIEKHLLAVPMHTGGRLDIYSGVARLSGTLWARACSPIGQKPTTAFVLVHPTSNFLGHYALEPLAAQGVTAVGMTTRYLGNDSALLMENCVLDVAAVVQFLRDQGFEKILLIGNSGGGGLAALYQSQAENPTISSTPSGDPPDLTRWMLPQVDGLIMHMAHPGRAIVYTEWLDPAIVDEGEPFRREPSLDMFDPRNGPPYSQTFLDQYRAAQLERNRRIASWVRERLESLKVKEHGALEDLPFVVHGTCADPRFLDLALDPSDRVRGTLWGDAYQANFMPATLGHATSLRSWLSQWSFADSQANAYVHLKRVSVPVLVVYGTADRAAFPTHACGLYDAVEHDDREIVSITGGDHYFINQPDLAKQACEEMARWAKEHEFV